jgi:UDP-N-acetylglucosamine 3-dehydrogenase
VTVDVAVLGLGTMGRQHARVLADLAGARLVAVCDRAPEARAHAEAHLPSVSWQTDWREVLAAGPGAVVNALPTGDHFEVTRAFLEAGVHVLVEKPIASTVAEAVELSRLARERGVVLMVGNVERFNPAVNVVKELVERGRMGEIVSVSARRVGVARPAVPHVNVALDLAIHDIDIISYVLGRNGELLMAAGAAMEPNRLEDHVDLVIRYGSTVATLQANWMTPVKIRRLSVTGTRAFLEVDYIEQLVHIYETVPEVVQAKPWDFFAVARESPASAVPVPRAEPLVQELAHFVECTRTGALPRTDADSATRALALAVEATAAMRGRADVSRASG